MSRQTLLINRLQACGPSRPTIELQFQRGLNVIYGASDTGKSYILECLNYMLGGSKPPKDIAEAEGYSSLYLEIEVGSNQFTLKRSIKGGAFLLFKKAIDQLEDSDPGEELENSGEFALSLLCAENVRLLKNQKGETRNLSFRDIRMLSMVGETRILESGSPVLTGQYIHETIEKSIFRYLMTGLDDSEYVGKDSHQKTKERVSYQLAVYDKLIEGANRQLTDMASENVDLEESVTSDDLSLQINSITDNVAVVGKEVDAALVRRDHVYAKKKASESRLGEITALLARFKFLRKQYQSDLERLEFIVEGQHLFTQLKAVECPYCGSKMKGHKSKKECANDPSETDISSACLAELSKVKTLMTDLESTVKRLEVEARDVNLELKPIQESLFTIQKNIEDILKPRIKSGKFTLQELIKQKDFVTRRENLESQLAHYEAERKKLQGLNVKPTTSKERTERIGKSYLEAFSKHVASLLTTWSFPYDGNVYVDTQTMDLVIGGKPRGSFGKGLRAVSHSAFVIGLMNYCLEKNFTHSGIVVLDSPLTAHRGKHKGKIVESQESDEVPSEREEVSKEIEEKFFSSLVSMKDRQIIILENVSPPDSIKSDAHCEFFSRARDFGRYGFYPEPKFNLEE